MVHSLNRYKNYAMPHARRAVSGRSRTLTPCVVEGGTRPMRLPTVRLFVASLRDQQSGHFRDVVYFLQSFEHV